MLTQIISCIRNWFYVRISKIKFGVTPKIIVIGNNDQKYRIPCYNAVVNYLKANKETVDYFLDSQQYNLANNLIFNYLKYYVPELAKFENSDENLTEVIDYIYQNLE